jgi:hypothetical protein
MCVEPLGANHSQSKIPLANLRAPWVIDLEWLPHTIERWDAASPRSAASKEELASH